MPNITHVPFQRETGEAESQGPLANHAKFQVKRLTVFYKMEIGVDSLIKVFHVFRIYWILPLIPTGEINYP